MPHYVLDARTATPHFPGIGRYVSNLARSLPPLLAEGERLTILCNPQHPVMPPASARVEQLPVAASPFGLAQQWQIPQLLRLLRADLYHSAYVAMPYAPGVDTILTVYDLIPLLFPEQSSGRARLAARWANRLALHAAQQVLAISEATRADYIRHLGVPPGKILTIPLAAQFGGQEAGVSGHVLRPAHYAIRNTQYALYLGSNKPHKNLVRLIEAWRIATSGIQHPASRLVIAGAWDERYPEARRRTEELGLGDKIVFLGPVAEADLPALYAGAALFVFASLYEGFGLPVLEAMACGTPVICSNLSSLPEVVGEPAAALLVDPYDVDALAGAIGRALADSALRAALRRRGLAQAAHFTWERTARLTLDSYRQLVGLPASSRLTPRREGGIMAP